MTIRRMPIKRVLCWFAVFAILCSCTRVRDGYSFIFASDLGDAAADGYPFKADLFDTTASYSTYISARIDPDRLDSDVLPLDILVVGPDGQISAERFDFPLLDCGGKVVARKAEGRCIDIEWPYRDRIKVGRGAGAPGVWSVRITPMASDSRAVLGLGFRYTDKDGKR